MTNDPQLLLLRRPMRRLAMRGACHILFELVYHLCDENYIRDALTGDLENFLIGAWTGVHGWNADTEQMHLRSLCAIAKEIQALEASDDEDDSL